MFIKEIDPFQILLLLLPWIFSIDKKAMNLENSLFIDKNNLGIFFNYIETRPKKLEAILVIMSIKW